jgi:Questin oxidase-like
MNPAQAQAQAHLHRLLDAGSTRFPETDDGLTSHLPMALHALHELGAGDERLSAFQAFYAPRFQRLVDELEPIVLPDWLALRGQADSYAALRAHFRAVLARDGQATVLRAVLPELLTGAAAAAFHGPIRVAHAVEAGHGGELACALAYWAWRWQPVAPPAASANGLDFEDWTTRLEAAALTWTPEAPLISLRIGMAEQSAPYQALAGALRLQADTLQRCTAWSAARYAVTQSFTVLHMVTGLRAIGLLLPLAGPGAAAAHTQGLVHALTAAYLAARMSVWPARPVAPDLDWDAIITAAVHADDDHVIKLVHAAWQFHRQTGDPVFHAAALRALA